MTQKKRKRKVKVHIHFPKHFKAMREFAQTGCGLLAGSFKSENLTMAWCFTTCQNCLRFKP